MTFFSPAGCCLLAHQSPVIMFADEGGSRRCHFKPAITGATSFLGDTFTDARMYKGNALWHSVSAVFYGSQQSGGGFTSGYNTVMSLKSDTNTSPFYTPSQCSPLAPLICFSVWISARDIIRVKAVPTLRSFETKGAFCHYSLCVTCNHHYVNMTKSPATITGW